MDTTTTKAPPRRSLTIAEFADEARARFGPDIADWAFECPGCGTVSAAKDFPEGCSDRVALAAVECIGRHVEGRGCQRIAYSLDPGPWLVTLASGSVVASFPFADALSEPLRAAQEIAPDDGPARAENPSAPPVAPVRSLSVERRHPGPRKEYPGISGWQQLDLENWNYRVALTNEQALLGYVEADPDVPLVATFVDTASGPLDWCHYLRDGIESTLEHIVQHELAIARQDVETALALIHEAYGEDYAATPAATELRPYWTAEAGWTDAHGIGCICGANGRSDLCGTCESLQLCPRCDREVLVPDCDMAAHQAEVHVETTESET